METKIPISDHDILITLVETVKNNHLTLLDKVGGVKQDVQDIKNGVTAQLSDHETRIRAVEVLHEKLNAQETYKQVQQNTAYIENQKASNSSLLKVLNITSSIVGGIIVLAVEAIIRIFFK